MYAHAETSNERPSEDLASQVRNLAGHGCSLSAPVGFDIPGHGQLTNNIRGVDEILELENKHHGGGPCMGYIARLPWLDSS
jgi:hypothetical protein